MKIGKYTPKDKKAVIALLVSNTPKYFDESEKEDLENYLANELQDYFVVEEDLKLLGAGGINYYPKENTASGLGYNKSRFTRERNWE